MRTYETENEIIKYCVPLVVGHDTWQNDDLYFDPQTEVFYSISETWHLDDGCDTYIGTLDTAKIGTLGTEENGRRFYLCKSRKSVKVEDKFTLVPDYKVLELEVKTNCFGKTTYEYRCYRTGK